MGTEVKATVVLEDKMLMRGKGHTGHEVQIDYLPPLGGDNGFMSTELLLCSLASCSAHTVLTILRRMGKTVEGLEVQAVGQRRDEHPTVFTHVELQYRLKGNQLDGPSVERAILLAEEKYCPVWAMLKSSVAISWKYSISP
jgi:putative redox protein